jgi:alkylated DNA repair dioxygenase AlkB
LTRRTQHFGFRYNYGDKKANVPTTPIPKEFEPLIARLLETRAIAQRPDQCIVNEYTPGQGIGMHTDHTGYFADGIVSVSLGAPVVMNFVNTDTKEKCDLLLPVGSALVLHGPARYKWQHGIVARKSDNGVPRGRRVSITFRKMK